MDLEQEPRPSVHPATDLKGYDRTVSDNAIDDKLVGDQYRQLWLSQVRITIIANSEAIAVTLQKICTAHPSSMS